MTVQAIIFDLDGLMVDTEALAKQAWRAVLLRYGHILDEGTINALFGLQLADSARLLWTKFSLPLSAEDVAKEKNELFMSMLAGNLHPMPGLYDLLDEVDKRGLFRALATSSKRDYVSMVLETIGLSGFSAVITAELVRAGKPAPDTYLAAAKALSLPPSACLALEDAPNGVQAAKAAGMRCVAVPNAMTARMDLSAADRLLPTLKAVADQLDSLIGDAW